MQAHYDAIFEREMGCTESDWRSWLPGAVGERPLHLGERSAEVTLDGGNLRLDWQPLPPRRIALITLPRLHVRFAFESVADAQRQRFMQRFDLYIQRGGG